MFIGLGLSGVIPVVHGLSIYGFRELEDRMSISWVIGHGAMYIFGAVLYAVSPADNATCECSLTVAGPLA